MLAMIKFVVLFLSLAFLASAAELPSKKYLNLAALKTMVAAVESEAQKRNVQVTICIMDESGNLLFLQKADGAGLNTLQFAQKQPIVHANDSRREHLLELARLFALAPIGKIGVHGNGVLDDQDRKSVVEGKRVDLGG